MRSHVAFVLCAPILLLAGCSQWGNRSGVGGANETYQEAVKEIKLATTFEGDGEPEGHSLHAVLNGEKVLISNAPWLSGLDDTQLTTLGDADSFVISTALGGEGGTSASVEEMAKVLAKGLATQGKISGHAQGILTVSADAKTPLPNILKVLEAGRKSGLERIYLAVNTEKGIRYLRPEAPSTCASIETVGMAAEDVSGFCAVPEVQPSDKGFMVTAREIAAGKLCEDGVGEDYKPATWSGQTMLSHKDICPSVKNKADKVNLKGLSVLLKEVAQIAPACVGASISGDTNTPWEQVAPAFVTMTKHTPFKNVSLTMATPASQAPEQACAAGLRPHSLPKVAERLVQDKRKTKRVNILGHLDDL